jgi:hypothetical protein
MATKYADRAFVSVNGISVLDVEAADLKQNFNAKPVDTMTPDGTNRGFVEGNVHVDLMIRVAQRNKLARAKLEAIDYENNDVQCTFVCGAEHFTAQGLFRKDVAQSSSGVGQQATGTFNLGALRVLDGVGNSSLFNLSL